MTTTFKFNPLAPMLEITIRSRGDLWLAETHSPNVGDWGHGSTPMEAVADLLTTLSELRDSLRTRKDHLAPSLLEDLEWLEWLGGLLT